MVNAVKVAAKSCVIRFIHAGILHCQKKKCVKLQESDFYFVKSLPARSLNLRDKWIYPQQIQRLWAGYQAQIKYFDQNIKLNLAKEVILNDSHEVKLFKLLGTVPFAYITS